jgi:pre-mRNA-splicing factor ISY1
MREKYVWEVQLRNLGGPNYIVGAGKIVDDDGKEIAGQRGYKYYGRARELPGIHSRLINNGV